MLLAVGGTVMTTSGSGQHLSGSFTAANSGWYTLDAYSDITHGNGNFSVQVSQNGGTALDLNTSNFHLVPDTGSLGAIGNFISSNGTEGYYPAGSHAVFSISLDPLNQSIVANGGSIELGSSTGLNTQLHLSGTALVDSQGNSYSYSQGVLQVPLSSSSSTESLSVSIVDAHGNRSDTVSSMVINGSADITPLTGIETLQFEFDSNGSAHSPSVITISNFNQGVSSGHIPENILDLRDLLSGENHAATASSPIGNLGNYLHFTTVTNGGETDTVIHVNANGAVNSGGGDTAQIVLQHVDLTHSGSTLLSDHQILQNLLGSGKIIVD
jgi:hypothetical protein